jgi:hypothetical protein
MYPATLAAHCCCRAFGPAPVNDFQAQLSAARRRVINYCQYTCDSAGRVAPERSATLPPRGGAHASHRLLLPIAGASRDEEPPPCSPRRSPRSPRGYPNTAGEHGIKPPSTVRATPMGLQIRQRIPRSGLGCYGEQALLSQNPLPGAAQAIHPYPTLVLAIGTGPVEYRHAHD